MKKHESRSWFTRFRGRLWIHASSKKPSQEEVERIQLFYLNRIDSPTFPSTYPTGCLLGCVTLEQVLPLEEYLESFPQGECDSDNYVFICSNAMQLQRPFPMTGQHKLFKLDPVLHLAAQKSLKLIQHK